MSSISYNKCHTPIGWQNDTTPALNDTNLNYTDGCIDTLDDRVVALASGKLEAEDVATSIKDVAFDDETGIFTFTRYNNTTFTIDTLLEKVVTNWHWSAETQKLEITLKDGTVQEVDLSDLISEVDVANSDHITLTITNHVITADIISHSIGDEQMQTGYLTDCQTASISASGSASSASASASDSEAYAVGKRGGIDVGSTDPTYHNNAKYYSQQASGQFLNGLHDVLLTSPSDGESLIYDADNQKWINGNATVDIIDNLTSTRTDAALSAHMGKVLNETIEGFIVDLFNGSITVPLEAEDGTILETEDGEYLMAERTIAL